MATWRRLRLSFPLPLVALAGILWPIAGDTAPQVAGDAAYRALPPQPAGDPARGSAGVERSAIALAAWLHGVPMADSTDPCPTDRLAVSWSAPVAAAVHGAYIDPLGPAPTDTTTAVNGIVVCRGDDSAFMGFQARYTNARWDVVAVPDTDMDAGETPAEPEPPAPLPPSQITFDGRTFGPTIEAPASYEPQRTCDPTAKVGTLALKNLLLRTYPGSRSLGIGTACDGTVSEHHEGRAFDFGVRVDVPSEKAMAQDFIDKLLATDQYGNQFALARRMGIMYLIWDHHIWSTYRAAEGWRDYVGVSPHTDHIHISMSWAGALGRTSFWSGNVAQELAGSNPPSGSLVASPASKGKARSSSAPPTTAPRRHRDVTIDTQLTSDDEAARDAARQQALDAWRARRAADDARRRSGASTTTTTWDQPWTTPTTSPSTSTTRPPRPTTTTTTSPPRTITAPRPTTTTTAPRPTTTTTAPRPTTTTTAPRPSTTTTTSTTQPRRRRTSPTTTAPAPSTSTTAAPTTTTTGAGN